MSNSLAIAAVTATLRNLLEQRINIDPTVDPSADPALAGTVVTTRPPDEAQNRADARQLNLFLYHTDANAAWRNMDMPRQSRPGETGQPPLPLNLYYLLTAYVRADNEDTAFLSHRLMGRAMSILHDHPVLGTEEVRNALPGNDLHYQVERVRITPQPLTLDEMSKLWTTFQSQYRVSAAYQVAVVLIESTRTARTPLPVLTRGPEDSGVMAQADTAVPTLDSLQLPPRQVGIRLDETLTLLGKYLAGDAVLVRFTHFRLTSPLDVSPLSRSATSVTVQLRLNPATDPATWPAGFYTVSTVVTRHGKQWGSNELLFTLCPRVTNLPLTVARDGSGNATMNLICTPEVRPEQRAALLLGNQEIVAQPHPTQTNSLTFVVRAATPGSYFARLRVDGADSLLVDRGTTTPGFDPNQQVTIT